MYITGLTSKAAVSDFKGLYATCSNIGLYSHIAALILIFLFTLRFTFLGGRFFHFKLPKLRVGRDLHLFHKFINSDLAVIRESNL